MQILHVSIILLFIIPKIRGRIMHGRYTRDLKEYQLSIPHKLTRQGEYSVFHLPHSYYYKSEIYRDRKKRSDNNDDEMIQYAIPIDGDTYHVELWPNRDFMHPNLVFEKRDSGIPVRDRQIRGVGSKKWCHYRGRVKGITDSSASISTCDGIIGHITIRSKRYFIEPVSDHVPSEKGHHLHIIYNKSPNDGIYRCGNKPTWKDDSLDRIKKEIDSLKETDDFKNNPLFLKTTPKFIEVAVVCDKKFLDYHKSRDVELYVMTLMNGVNDLYRDNSTGQLITVEVVRVIYLEKEEEEIDLEVSGNALKTLESFGRWVNRINQPMDSPTHHDVGILLSKFDLCINSSTKEGCEITGLAKTATACKKDGSAACIAEDMGLGLYTVIIAHEIGHLLGLVDDQKERHCNSIDPADGSHYVMSPHTHVYTIKWSECSRDDFKSFFQTKQSECLDDEPTTNLFPYIDNMPGVIYNENDQCRIMFPESNGACHPTTLDFCSFLICRTFNNTKCTGIKGQGPVDGTKCADSKWCYKQKCVAMGSRPGAINGGWSDWTDWSPCSRTCGGGVTYRERYCSSPTPTNRGKYCIGDRKSVKLCNTQLCPEDSISFREQQCKEQDLKSIKSENITYHWTAVYNFDSPCTLICFTKGLGLFNFGNAKDGTLCNPGTRNLCIAGHCKTVGCDLKINSEAIEDRCGICNGDGTTCRLVDGTYNEEVSDPKKMPPDQAIANIPVGSRKIFIKELEESVNILAISDKNKKEPTFFLNKGGNSKFRGSFKLPGTKGFYYTKGKNMEQDHIVIDGPTSIDLVVWLMYFKNNIGEFSNPGYHYQWAEPEERNKYDPVYSWEIGEYGDCSARCGGGVQEPIWSCMEEKGGMVSPTYCIGINKPTQHSKKCNEQSCHTRWNVGSWGKCHACKKKGGVRTRSVQCLQQNPNIKGESILVEDSQCTGPKPGSIQLCESDVHCTVRKKRNVFIPGMHQSSVWKQMNRINIYKRETDNQSQEPTVESNHEEIEHISTLEPNQENNTELVELKEILKSSSAVIQRVTTKFVVDKEPLDEQEIIEFELIHHKSNISDNKMKGEELGDILGTTKLFRGIELEKLKHELEFKHRIVHSIPTTETAGTKTFKTTTEKETKTKSTQNQNSKVH